MHNSDLLVLCDFLHICLQQNRPALLKGLIGRKRQFVVARKSFEQLLEQLGLLFIQIGGSMVVGDVTNTTIGPEIGTHI